MTRETLYQKRIGKFKDSEAEQQGISNRLSNFRLLAFGAALVCGVIGTLAKASPPVLLLFFALAFVCFGVFIWLVYKHRQIIELRDQFALMRRLNEDALHRLHREWDQFPVPPAPKEFTENDTAQDLDIFGQSSLFQLICTQSSPQGRYTLAKWLVEPSVTKQLKPRNKAVKALAEELDWRQEQAAIGEMLALNEAERIPKWTHFEAWTEKLPNWFFTYLKWSPLAFLLLIIQFFFWFPLPIFALIPIINAWLTRKYRFELVDSTKELSQEENNLRGYSRLFEHLEQCPKKDKKLTELVKCARDASTAMDDLNNIANRAAARGSMIYPFLVGVLLWDFRIARSMEQWQNQHADQLDYWFESLGEFEAIASLASLHYDETEWVFPKLTEKGAIDGETIAHPLISEKVRIGNSVSVGPEGRFLLVTGSNMSGKSTLLRSIGLNVTLAQAGAPVCAKRLSLPPLSIATSMRVQDSLSDGLSFFMAELKRIKEVVIHAKTYEKEDRNVLFLLDEILQGTNTVERREIVQRVIKHLVDCGAIGAITTHDLALAEMDSLTENADLVHFREDFKRNKDGKPNMTFDYKMRKGVATTTNALKILEVIEMPV